MRKIGEGDKSEVFALPDGRILKLFFSRHAPLADVEHQRSVALERSGVDAPRVQERRAIDGRPALIFANLAEGETLSRRVRRHPWRIRSAARTLAALHANVHLHAARGLPSQRERLTADIRASDVLSDQARAAALARLAALPDGGAVCHNDIHMLNVIVHPAGTSIIDWVLASRGNPLADVATAEVQLRFGETPGRLVIRVALDVGRVLFFGYYRQHYLKLADRSGARDELARWRLPVAAALSGRRAGTMQRQLLDCVEREMKHDGIGGRG